VSKILTYSPAGNIRCYAIQTPENCVNKPVFVLI